MKVPLYRVPLSTLYHRHAHPIELRGWQFNGMLGGNRASIGIANTEHSPSKNHHG